MDDSRHSNLLYWSGRSLFLRGELGRLLLASQYQGASDLMPWIALGYAFLAVSYVFEKICYAHSRTKLVSLIQMFGTLSIVGLSFPSIQLLGLQGAAFAVPVAFGLQLIVSIAVGTMVLRQRDQPAFNI